MPFSFRPDLKSFQFTPAADSRLEALFLFQKIENKSIVSFELIPMHQLNHKPAKKPHYLEDFSGCSYGLNSIIQLALSGLDTDTPSLLKKYQVPYIRKKKRSKRKKQQQASKIYLSPLHPSDAVLSLQKLIKKYACRKKRK